MLLNREKAFFLHTYGSYAFKGVTNNISRRALCVDTSNRYQRIILNTIFHRNPNDISSSHLNLLSYKTPKKSMSNLKKGLFFFTVPETSIPAPTANNVERVVVDIIDTDRSTNVCTTKREKKKTYHRVLPQCVRALVVKPGSGRALRPLINTEHFQISRPG